MSERKSTIHKAQQLLTVLQLAPPDEALDEGQLRTGASTLMVRVFDELFSCQLAPVARPKDGGVLSADDKAHNASLVLRALAPNVPAAADISPEAIAEGDLVAIGRVVDIFVRIAAQQIKARAQAQQEAQAQAQAEPDPRVVARAANMERPGTSHSSRRFGAVQPERRTAALADWEVGSNASSDRDTDVAVGTAPLSPRRAPSSDEEDEEDEEDEDDDPQVSAIPADSGDEADEGDEDDDREALERLYPGLAADQGEDRSVQRTLAQERTRARLQRRELAARAHSRDERAANFRSRRQRVVRRSQTTQKAQAQMLQRMLENEKCTRCPQGPALELERILASKFRDQLGELWQEYEAERRAAQRMQRDAEQEREERLRILRDFYDERCRMVKAQIAEHRREAETATQAYIHETEKLVRELTEARKAQLELLEARRRDRATDANTAGVNALCREIASAERRVSKKRRSVRGGGGGGKKADRWATCVRTYGGVEPGPPRVKKVPRRRRRRRPQTA